jgi:hypothetical protein
MMLRGCSPHEFLERTAAYMYAAAKKAVHDRGMKERRYQRSQPINNNKRSSSMQHHHNKASSHQNASATSSVLIGNKEAAGSSILNHLQKGTVNHHHHNNNNGNNSGNNHRQSTGSVDSLIFSPLDQGLMHLSPHQQQLHGKFNVTGAIMDGDENSDHSSNSSSDSSDESSDSSNDEDENENDESGDIAGHEAGDSDDDNNYDEDTAMEDEWYEALEAVNENDGYVASTTATTAAASTMTNITIIGSSSTCIIEKEEVEGVTRSDIPTTTANHRTSLSSMFASPPLTPHVTLNTQKEVSQKADNAIATLIRTVTAQKKKNL